MRRGSVRGGGDEEGEQCERRGRMRRGSVRGGGDEEGK